MRAILISIVITALTSCTTAPPKADVPPAETKAFSGQMQNMAQDVRDLVPYIYDREAFQAPANRAQVESALDRFAQASHQVTDTTGQAILGDPLLVERTLQHLRDDVTRALGSYRDGQYEFARSVAKASLSNCFQCHSVTPPGGAAKWDIDQMKDLTLAPLEKFDLLVATRKFDRATELAEQTLKDPNYLRDHAFDFEALLRRYLALVIRVEVAPQRASHALDRVLEKIDLPKYDADQITAWRASLKVWAKEPVRKVKTAKDVFTQVNACLARAAKLQHFEKDHAADVEYLRATAILHNNLKLLRVAADEARALYLLGRAYEVMDDLGSYNLHESYYEACVTKDPKGPLGRTCYERLEQSLLMGFSGSAGTHLPADERERLRRLKELL